MTGVQLGDVLGQVRTWPVDHASAALITPAGSGTLGDSHRVYELASVTKLLASYGVLMAVEEGAFELDDACGPDGATVRHLLAHASGVGFASREPIKAPEQRRIYSSAGFEILADFVADTTGIAFADYLREGVFEPLGMTATELYGSAGHGARSTLADLVSFAGELLAPTLLDESTLRTAFSVHYPDLRGVVPGYGMQKPCPWGLGFEIHGEKSPHWLPEDMPPETVGHFGMTGTYVWLVPSWAQVDGAGCAMVALTDRDFGPWATTTWAETNAAIFKDLLRLGR
ncbi:serine hydrolase domain-containing protein [Corynebacterium uterequi]|uniref:Penicillin-binding protein, beta-lactamase class C n=1 Tax=Corynebacterium uterequi TaxID=1072256 RepID=A0A0G3HFL9_9CORY|nr:serine hydrolase domain-containing protein [Corynebacterium uterequi]AKK11555.1 penicillin-binding protein, beta-lactamase class C [Corynebacterium uterequi]